MRKTIQKIVSITFIFLLVFMGAGCSLFVKKDAWDTQADVYEYLNKYYPGISFTVSDHYSFGFASRNWKVTSEEYPGLTFNVSNTVGYDGVTPFPNFNKTNHSDNIYEELLTHYKKTFLETVEETYGTKAYELLELEDESHNKRAISFIFKDISDLDVAKEIIEDFEEGWFTYSKGQKQIRIYLHMYIEDAISRYGANADGIHDEISNLATDTFFDEFEEAYANFRKEVIEYSVINAINAVGVTDEMKMQYFEDMEKENRFDSGTIHYGIVKYEDYVPFLVQQSIKNEDFIMTRGSLIKLCEYIGLEVKNIDQYYHSFTVIGADGKAYEFVETYDYVNREGLDVEMDYLVDGEPHTLVNGFSHFAIDLPLAETITGVKLEVYRPS